MMDPSHDGRGPPKDPSLSYQSSSQMHGDAPPPMMAPPQMMYYPQATGYHPGYAPQLMPHQGYPPGYVPQPYEYPQVQAHHYPAGPYNNNPQPIYYKRSAGKAIVRCFITCSCILLTGFFVATLVAALVLHPQFPIYSVNSVAVTNFNTTPTLSGNWNTIVSIHNINDKLYGLFSDFKVDLLHKDVVLALSYIPEFTLNKNETRQFDGNPSTNGFTIPKWALEDMAREQGNGSIVFTIRISSTVEFRSSTMSTRKAVVIGLCNNLNVVFQNNTGNGTLDNGGKPITCELYM